MLNVGSVFVALSLILLVVGWASILMHGGLRYGSTSASLVGLAGDAVIDGEPVGTGAPGPLTLELRHFEDG